MPVRRGSDSQGPFYLLGSFKFRYVSGDKASRDRAKVAAICQGFVVRANQAQQRGRR